MNDSTSNTPAETTKAKTVANDMTARKVFANPTDAIAYLSMCASTYADFATTPFARPGISDAGVFDPAIYNDSTEVMVAKLSNKGAGVKAIVVLPVPTLDSILARPDAREWLQKIVYKELNHVGVRVLREAEDISTVIDQMPTTLDGFIATGRDGSAGIMEAFNDLYKPVNAVLSSKVPAWNKARFTKNELKKALESKAYAMEYYSAVEDRGEGKDSLLVVALNMLIGAAKSKGIDPTIFERWKDSRNAKTITVTDDEESLDLDSLTAAMLVEPAETPAAETPTA